MQILGDNSPSFLTAFVRRFASRIGDLSHSVPPVWLATLGSQRRLVNFLIENYRFRLTRKIAHLVLIPFYADHAQSTLPVRPIDAYLSERVWNLASKPAPDPRAQGRAA